MVTYNGYTGIFSKAAKPHLINLSTMVECVMCFVATLARITKSLRLKIFDDIYRMFIGWVAAEVIFYCNLSDR